MPNFRRIRQLTGPILVSIALAVVVLWSLIPVAWLVTTSLKPGTLTFAIPPVWIFVPTLENYIDVIAKTEFLLRLWNTLLVACVTSVLATLFGSLSAYSFTRFNFRGSQSLPLFYLVLRMIPRMVLVVPYYMLMRQLGLLNTRTSLVLSYITFSLPFAIWMMMGFLKEIPTEMEDAGLVDGCTRLQVLRHIVVPVAMPGIVTTALFCFSLAWNEFLFSLILAGPDTRTLPVLISSFETDRGIMWGQITAAGTLTVIPVVALAIILQRHIVRGMTMGSVKG